MQRKIEASLLRYYSRNLSFIERSISPIINQGNLCLPGWVIPKFGPFSCSLQMYMPKHMAMPITETTSRITTTMIIAMSLFREEERIFSNLKNFMVWQQLDKINNLNSERHTILCLICCSNSSFYSRFLLLKSGQKMVFA